MHNLGIDIETFSPVNLDKCGVFKYSQAEGFKILLLSYALDNGPVRVFDLTQRDLPQWVIDALSDPDYLKTAHNALFERICLQAYLGKKLDASQWECTMVKASMLGYPLSLDRVSQVMGLAQQKDRSGKALIKFFTVPNKQGERNKGEDHPTAWDWFKHYNIQDVAVEQGIREKIDFFKIPPTERRVWLIDQKINEKGVMLDKQLASTAIQVSNVNYNMLMQKAIALTGLQNPNSIAQLKTWLEEETLSDIKDLTKDSVTNLLDGNPAKNVEEVLLIRREMSKSSLKKYKAMLDSVGCDDRVRGLFQLYGANKTGRWSSRIVQLQNLTPTDIKLLDLARECLKRGDVDTIQLIWDNLSYTLSALIRTSFIASPGKELLISDFSAIEARVTAWYANEGWRLEIFNGHGMIYEASAAQMFKVPIEKVTKGSEYRKKGKIAELALGYQGSVGAMIKMGSRKMNIPDDDLQDIVDAWREANPNIVKLWYAVDDAAVRAVRDGGVINLYNKLKFFVAHDTLFIKLPSGRCLSYVSPKIKINKFNREAVAYMGVDQETKRWVPHETYGGKLVENIVQGTARDLLADGMIRLDDDGFDLVMHVHDETVSEIDKGDERSVHRCTAIMSEPVIWAPGLPLKAVSETSPYYIKEVIT